MSGLIHHDPDLRPEVEIRLFLLNGCTHKCYNCFYNRNLGNDFRDYKGVLEYTLMLKSMGYHHETLFLFPIDYLDEQMKDVILDNPDFLELASHFVSLGIATTFLSNYSIAEFERMKAILPAIDVFVNLDYKQFDNPDYFKLLSDRISEVKELYGEENAIINCAVNLGAKLKPEWVVMINKFKELSTDKNIELNFTYLSNPSVLENKANKFFEKSLGDLNTLRSEVYENLCASETILNKITLVFMGDGTVYFSPMIPYDEAINLRYDKYQIHSPNEVFDVIQRCYEEPIPTNCRDCDDITFCMGKGYLSIMNTLGIGCYKQY